MNYEPSYTRHTVILSHCLDLDYTQSRQETAQHQEVFLPASMGNALATKDIIFYFIMHNYARNVDIELTGVFVLFE